VGDGTVETIVHNTLKFASLITPIEAIKEIVSTQENELLLCISINIVMK
jgi:hypothetical protein